MAIGETINRNINTSLRILTRRLEILEGKLASPQFGGKSLRNIGANANTKRALRNNEEEALNFKTYKVVSADYTILSDDSYIECTSPINITLLASTLMERQELNILNTSLGNVTIIGTVNASTDNKVYRNNNVKLFASPSSGWRAV